VGWVTKNKKRASWLSEGKKKGALAECERGKSLVTPGVGGRVARERGREKVAARGKKPGARDKGVRRKGDRGPPLLTLGKVRG